MDSDVNVSVVNSSDSLVKKPVDSLLDSPPELTACTPGTACDFAVRTHTARLSPEVRNLSENADSSAVLPKAGLPRDNYFKACKWSPDGTCLLTATNANELLLFDFPFSRAPLLLDAEPSSLRPSLSVRPGGSIYDYGWFPFMLTDDPGTACFVTCSRSAPVHLWDAFTGTLRASYTAKNHVDQVVSCFSVKIDPANGGRRLYAGALGVLYCFDLTRPGPVAVTSKSSADANIIDVGRAVDVSKECDVRKSHISCIGIDAAEPGLLALGMYNGAVCLMDKDGASDCEKIVNAHDGMGVTHVILQTSANRVFSGARKHNYLCCYDIRCMTKPLFKLPRPVDTNQRVLFDIDPNNRFLLSGDKTGSINVWNLDRVTVLGASDSQGSEFSPDFIIDARVNGECMVDGVSYHSTWPLLASTTGQRTVFADIDDTDSSDDEDLRLSKPKNPKAARKSFASELSLWYVGNTT